MITYESTITLGNLIAIVCMVLPALFVYFYVIRLATRVETKLDIVVRLAEFDRRLMNGAALEAIRAALIEHDGWERLDRAAKDTRGT